MKILGIMGSARQPNKSSTFKLGKIVLENTGLEYEIINLCGEKILGCIAYLGFVTDNVYKLKDDFNEFRSKIIEADAYVISAPNYYFTINSLKHVFLERWFQFRHKGNDFLWEKLGVAVGGILDRFVVGLHNVFLPIILLKL